MDQLSSPSSYAAPAADEGAQSIPASAVGKFVKCGHTLHMLCMLAMYNNGTKVAEGSLTESGQIPESKKLNGKSKKLSGHVTASRKRACPRAGRQSAVSLL